MYYEKVMKPTVGKETIEKAAERMLEREEVRKLVILYIREELELAVEHHGGVVEEPLDDFYDMKAEALYDSLKDEGKRLVEEESVMKEHEVFDPDHPINKAEIEERVNRVAEKLKKLKEESMHK